MPGVIFGWQRGDEAIVARVKGLQSCSSGDQAYSLGVRLSPVTAGTAASKHFL
jgi:hypothetical protein